MSHLRLIWNLLCIAFIAFWIWIITPKIIPQFTQIDSSIQGAFRNQVIMGGFEGIAVLLLFALAAISTTSIFWTRVGWTWRTIYILAGIAFAVGAQIGRRVEYEYLGTNLGNDRAAFLLSYVIIAFPIVFLAMGWPRILFVCGRRFLPAPDSNQRVEDKRS